MQALRTCRDFSSHVVVRHLGRGSVSRVALLRRERRAASEAGSTEAKHEGKQEAREKEGAAPPAGGAPSAAAGRGEPSPEGAEPAMALVKGGHFGAEDLPDYVVAKSVSVDGGYEDKHLQQIEVRWA